MGLTKWMHIIKMLSFCDDVTGLRLQADKVKEARRMELEYVDGKPLYTEVDVAGCFQATGKKPISTKWVDTDKGDGQYRSRWVARDFKTGTSTDFFAATPPWEAVKFLVSLMASQGMQTQGPGRKSRRSFIKDVGMVRRMLEAGDVKMDFIDKKGAYERQAARTHLRGASRGTAEAWQMRAAGI